MNWLAIPVMAAIDAPWLYTISGSYARTITAIQSGSAPEYRIWGAIPVYLGLVYILSYAKTLEQAVLLGIASYAVYDFTVLTLFKKYPIWIALADMLWGGILFGLVFWALRWIQDT